jgi:hypothetical protein
VYRVLALKCCDNTIFDQFALLNNGRTTEPQGHHIGALKEIELTDELTWRKLEKVAEIARRPGRAGVR